MKICVYGAGAVGGYLGALLARTKHDVTLIARGEHAKTMRDRGIRLQTPSYEFTTPVKVVEQPTGGEGFDLVIIALKSHQIAGVAEMIAASCHDETCIMSAINGVPWWHFHKFGSKLEGVSLKSVDPGATIWNALRPERAIGCVPYVASAVPEPGFIKVTEGYNEFHIGDPLGGTTPRIKSIAEVFEEAGIPFAVHDDIRVSVWRKLLGNMTTNPISVLTGATMEQMFDHEGVCDLIRRVMREGVAIAQVAGVALEVDIEERIKVLRTLGAFKTSMLQDWEAGKPIELEPIVGAPLEIARLLGLEAQNLETVYGLLGLKADVR